MTSSDKPNIQMSGKGAVVFEEQLKFNLKE